MPGAERRNFGLAGGTLKPPEKPPVVLSVEDGYGDRRVLHPVEVQLYVELGLDQIERHANWGV